MKCVLGLYDAPLSWKCTTLESIPTHRCIFTACETPQLHWWSQVMLMCIEKTSGVIYMHKSKGVNFIKCMKYAFSSFFLFVTYICKSKGMNFIKCMKNAFSYFLIIIYMHKSKGMDFIK